MKNIFLFIISFLLISTVQGQEFNAKLTEAKTAYASGKLDDARFAMQQMLQELDIIMGKELLKILPQKMEDKSVNTKADNVSGSSGFYGVIIHREYGTAMDGNISLDVIINSPVIGSLNAMLSLPFVSGNADQKIIKVNGYKALVQKNSGDEEKTEYELQLPLNNSLITLKAPGYTQEQLIKMANTLPVADMSKHLQ